MVTFLPFRVYNTDNQLIIDMLMIGIGRVSRLPGHILTFDVFVFVCARGGGRGEAGLCG